MSDGVGVGVGDSGSEGGRSPPPPPAVSLRPGPRAALRIRPLLELLPRGVPLSRPVPRGRNPRQAGGRAGGRTRGGGLPGVRPPRFRGSWCLVTRGRGGQRPRGAPPERASGPGCTWPSRGKAEGLGQEKWIEVGFLADLYESFRGVLAVLPCDGCEGSAGPRGGWGEQRRARAGRQQGTGLPQPVARLPLSLSGDAFTGLLSWVSRRGLRHPAAIVADTTDPFVPAGDHRSHPGGHKLRSIAMELHPHH